MAVTQAGTPTATAYITATGSATNTWSGTQPRTAGDLLVMVITAAATTSVTAPAAPAGWNTGVAVGNTATAHAYVAIFWKIAAGADAAPSTTVTLSGTARCGCTLLELTGNEQILSPVDATGTEASGSTAASYTTITVTAGSALSYAGDYVISAFAFEYTTASSTSAFAAGTGWTNFSNDSSTSSRDHNAVDHITSTPAQGSTPSDAASATSDGTGFTAAALIAFAPPHDPPLWYKPVRAAIPPKPRLAGVYMGASPPLTPPPAGTLWTPPASDTSFGTGQVQWNAGGPVSNPNIPGPSGPPLGWSSPVGVRAVYVRTGLAMATLIPPPGGTPPAPTPAPFFPVTRPVQARLPQHPVLRGRTASSKGAPVRNPASGPVFYQASSPVRARIPREAPSGSVTGTGSGGAICGAVNGNGFGNGNGSEGAPVSNPAPGPVFYPRRTPVRFTLPPWHPAAGRIGFNKGAAVQNPIHGPPAYPLQGPVHARVPQLHPRAGRIYANAGVPAAAVPHPAPLAALTQPVKAKLPLQPFLRGRMASVWGGPVQNPAPGPAFTQATSPARIRASLPLRGRTGSNPGIRVKVTSGPVLHPQGLVRGRIPQTFSKGRVSASPGAPVRNPVPGPVFTQKTSPARIRPSLPPRGRIAFSKGAPVSATTTGPAFYPKTYAKAQLPLSAAGRIRSNPGGPVQNPVSGPPILSAGQPAGLRVVFLATGRAQSTAIAAAGPQNPTSGPVFYPARRPVQARFPLPPRGRTGSDRGVLAVTPAVPPVFAQKTFVRAQLPLARRGTCRAIRFYGLQANPVPGPVFYPATAPVRARFPLPPKGRVASNRGAPVNNPVPAVAFTQKTYPARIRPSLPPRGRIAFNAGGPVSNPVPGPVFRPAVHPAQPRIPQVFTKGRIASSPGGPVSNPPAPVYPWHGPVRVHPALPPRGRVASGRGTPLPALAKIYPLTGPVRTHPALPPRGRTGSDAGSRPPQPAPLYPLQHPVKAQFPLPPRGRAGSNPGVPVAIPTPGPKVYPAKGPVQARRPLPPHGRAVTGNPGAPVRNPQPGPVFRQAVRPIRAVIPQNAPRGRTAGNPGGPVANIPFATLKFRTGSPHFQWETDIPGFQWGAGDPSSQWQTGIPEAG